MDKCKFIIIVICFLLRLINCISHRNKSKTVRKIDRQTGEATAVDQLIQKYEKENKKFYSKETQNERTLMNKCPKRKWIEITSQMNNKTGQPIAKEEYLLQYEFEHQNLLHKEGKFIDWPYAMAHRNLDCYCYQYMGKCAPCRKRNGVTGSWKIDKLHYQKLRNSKFVYVTIIRCVSAKPSILRYYLTKAPEPNCVYALLLRGYNMPTYETPYYVIIFKHCDFESLNDQQVTSCNHNISHENMIRKSEMKEEPLITSETLQLFPQD